MKRRDARANARKILRLYRKGTSPPEIARRLGISPTTVNNHLRSARVPRRLELERAPHIRPERRPPYWELRLHGAHNPAGEVVLGRKFCTGCGRWRHVVDFDPYTRNGRPMARCQACQNAAKRWHWHNMPPEQRTAVYEYVRIYRNAKLREAGGKPRERRSPSVVDRPEYVFLSLPPLVGELERLNGDLGMIAKRAGVPERTILRLRTGESRRVRIDVADKLAVAMGIPLELLYRGEGVEKR
jgi:predicted Fe-S protein YdhL (DUF1289 family)